MSKYKEERKLAKSKTLKLVLEHSKQQNEDDEYLTKMKRYLRENDKESTGIQSNFDLLFRTAKSRCTFSSKPLVNVWSKMELGRSVTVQSTKVGEVLQKDRIIITSKDLQNVMRIVQSHKATHRTLENPLSTDFTFLPHIPKGFETHAVPCFVYTTEVVRNTLLLNNEYIRDDFYLLQFHIPDSFTGKHCSLKLIDLTSKKHNTITFAHVTVEEEKRSLFFDSVMQSCFNPRKRLPWVHCLEDLVGNLYKVEIMDEEKVNSKTFTKYLCFDYFSYENYLTSLIEIAYFQKLSKEKAKRNNEQNTEQESKEVIENIMDAFKKLNKAKKEGLVKPGAFRHLLFRLKSDSGFEPLTTSKSKHALSVKYVFSQTLNFCRGETVIEYKNCIIKAISQSTFQLLAGSISSLQNNYILKENVDGLITVSLFKDYPSGTKGSLGRDINVGSQTMTERMAKRDEKPKASHTLQAQPHILFPYNTSEKGCRVPRKIDQYLKLVERKHTKVNRFPKIKPPGNMQGLSYDSTSKFVNGIAQ